MDGKKISVKAKSMNLPMKASVQRGQKKHENGNKREKHENGNKSISLHGKIMNLATKVSGWTKKA